MKKIHNSPHKYRRIILGRDHDWPIYRCFIPRCTHQLPATAMIGQAFICGVCEEEDAVNDTSDLLVRTPLKCRRCRKQKDVAVEKILTVVEEVIKKGE